VVYDTTIGWRFVNRLVKERYGVDSMPETAENVAVDFGIEREAQDRMAMASQHKTLAEQAGFLDVEIRCLSVSRLTHLCRRADYIASCEAFPSLASPPTPPGLSRAGLFLSSYLLNPVPGCESVLSCPVAVST
jgi:hypothetical protein